MTDSCEDERTTEPPSKGHAVRFVLLFSCETLAPGKTLVNKITVGAIHGHTWPRPLRTTGCKRITAPERLLQTKMRISDGRKGKNGERGGEHVVDGSRVSRIGGFAIVTVRQEGKSEGSVDEHRSRPAFLLI